MLNQNLIRKDIEEVFEDTQNLLTELQGKNIFLTGGTGFLGKWLLEYFKYLNEEQDAKISIYILTRNIPNFTRNHPSLYHSKGFYFQEGDIRDFKFAQQNIDYCIHAATEASATLNKNNPNLMQEVIEVGMQRVLDFCKFSHAKKILFMSSGAVYGPNCSASEDQKLLMPSGTAYGDAKRYAEQMGLNFSKINGVDFIIARYFSFVGPYLPPKSTYAIKDFLCTAINQGVINIDGDGTPIRSYMYPTDFITWTIHLLLHGKSCIPYNVGSGQEISLKDLAEMIRRIIGKVDIRVLNQSTLGVAPNKYVPIIENALKLHSLKIKVGLKEAIMRTIASNYFKSSE